MCKNILSAKFLIYQAIRNFIPRCNRGVRMALPYKSDVEGI